MSGPGRKSRTRPGRWIGPLRITPIVVAVAIALVGSAGYILWVVREVQDDQIPDLAVGFTALGVSFAMVALGALVGIWRAASRAAGGRSFALALVGGLAAVAAIGSFSVTALLMLVWNS